VYLGLLQGVTEFLPISSSGHLVILRHLLGVDFSEAPLLLDTILHLGTLLAVVVVFYRDLQTIAVDGWAALRHDGLKKGWSERPHLRLLGWIVLATLPAVIVGFSLADVFERAFSSLTVVGVALLFTAALLFASRWASRGDVDLAKLKSRHALIVGILQATAITPGVSRSGATIVAGLFAGLDRETAGRFSFLIAIPAILGAVLLQAMKIDHLPAGFIPAAIGGFVAAAISGYCSLLLLLRFVKAGRLHWFGVYCMLVGIWALLGA